MNWSIQDNTRGLIAFDIPVNEKTLFGAHKFGFENYILIYNANDNESLNSVLGEEKNNPVFNNFKTIKSIKDYISSKVKVEDN